MKNEVYYIIISGKQGSGKTSLGNALSVYLSNEQIIVKHTRFAKIIYKLHDQIRKTMSDLGFKVSEEKDGELLQYLGTDWGRNKFGPDVWCSATKKDVDIYFKNHNIHIPKIAIISDCRFKNELDYFPNSLKIRLVAPEAIRKLRCEYWRENVNHQSETDLDEAEKNNEFDLIFNTDNEDMRHNLINICDAIMSKLISKGVL
jgi:cytidylate kinase